MKEIVFILSSLNDPHYRKRVEEFIDHGYRVKVYGFKRLGQKLDECFKYQPIILGEIENRKFASRLVLFNNSIKSIAKECKGKICFYSSLDVAMFAHLYIRSPYIYEVCDLTELTIGNSLLRCFFTWLNKYTIKKSIVTIITSEGFSDHFRSIESTKMWLIPNKVSPYIPNYEYATSRTLNLDKIRIGFVGAIRYESIYHFTKACVDYGRNIELHLFGIFSDGDEWSLKVKQLSESAPNVLYHGKFLNPQDLPSIYSQIDLVLCTYTPSLGVKYAEPNKLYEAIYFRCPIIVSKNVFLEQKVTRLGIGYAINAMNEESIIAFLDNIDCIGYKERIEACERIPKSDCLNENDSFFDYIVKCKK